MSGVCAGVGGCALVYLSVYGCVHVHMEVCRYAQ